jgi:poly-gamma-glutamate synthesis protein (capsule biosynthesis protein)
MKFHLNTKNSTLISLLFIVIITASGYFVYSSISVEESQNTNSSVPDHEDTLGIIYDDTPSLPNVRPSSIESRIAVFGDVFWGRYVHDWSMQSEEKYNYPFSQLDTLGKQEDEYWIANLECPVTDQTLDSATQENLLKFNCLPEYLPYANQWFNAFSLANNHTDNMEEFDGYTRTKNYLNQNDITPFGHYDNDLDDLCTVVRLPTSAQYQASDQSLLDTGQANTDVDDPTIPVALCGFHSVFRLLTDEEISHISEFARHIPTIAFPHSGAEYVTSPDQIKTNTYRAMIDAGADAVIGSHPHAVQTTEVYNNKLIVYSQGNFIFDQQFSTMTTTHLGLRATISITDQMAINNWSDIPPSCFNITYLCDSLKSVNKPKFTIEYTPLYSSNPNKITNKATEAEIQNIQNVSNIEQTLTLIQN